MTSPHRSQHRTGPPRWSVLALLAGAATAGPATSAPPAPPAPGARTDLAARLETLETQVAALRDPGRRWLTTQRAQEIRTLTEDVLAEVDTRASLLGPGVTAGWEQGFFIASPDGGFRLDLSGQVQVRWVGSFQDDGPVDDARTGFELSRTRLGFGGFVIDPSWTWFVWSGWTATGRSLLLDAWIRKSFAGGWALTVGQFKLPIWQEWIISEKRQQFIARSVLNARYASLYGQGVMVAHTSDHWRGQFVVSDGVRTWGTPWDTSPAETAPPLPYQLGNEYAITGRLETRIGGTWAGAAQFESPRGEARMAFLGGAVHYQRGAFGTDDDEDELLQWTLDASIKLDGANVYAAVIGTHVDAGDDTRNEWGVLVQAGVFLDDDWELVARYEWGDLDGAGTVDDTLSVLTVGVNLFWRRHSLKWSADIGYGFDPIDPAWAGTGVGWRPDAPGGDGQIVVRSQVQVLF